ncbi:glycosyltransferase family 4 protein [Paludibaculum fermentans]|uniref:glycosyltransferase family 4 protein n=1 Tax=Paludibaculum fermentans TaxID=1473598 RepID=UPI003EB769C1
MSEHKRLLYLGLADLERNPIPELSLPGLVRAGWDVTIVAPSATTSVYNRCLPYPAKRIDVSPGHGLRREAELLRWLLRGRLGSYDLVYVMGQAIAPRAALCYLGSGRTQRLIYHTHDFFDPNSYPIRFALEGTLARKAACHLNGEYHRAYLCKTFYKLTNRIMVAPPNLPSVWPIPARSEATRSLHGVAPDETLLVLHGGHSALRATDILIEALSLLPPHFKLAMTSTRTRTIEAVANRCGVLDRIIFLGAQDYVKMLQFTVNGDIGILLHVNNDLGNFFQAPGRLTEYLACGLPVLTSNFTGLQLLVKEHGLGRAVNPESAADVAAGLIRLDLERRAGQFERTRIRGVFDQHFAFENWESRVVQTIEAAIRDTNPPEQSSRIDFSVLGVPTYANSERTGGPGGSQA